MESSGRFPRGKPVATEWRYPALISYLLVNVEIIPSVGWEAYSFTTDGYGMFNVRARLQTKGGHSQTSLHS